MKLKRFIVCLLCLCMLTPMTVVAETEENSVYTEENFSAWREWAKLSYTIPNEYKDNVLALLDGERDEYAYVDITDVVRCSETNDIFVSFKGTAYQQNYHIGGNAGPDAFYDDGKRCTAMPKFMILDRDTGEVLGYESFFRRMIFDQDKSEDYGIATVEENNWFVDLPDYFDSSKHKLMFYLEMRFDGVHQEMAVEEYEVLGLANGYYINDAFNGKFYCIYNYNYTITEPVEIDVMQSIPCMDVTADGKINLKDAAIVLKHIANWDVEIDTLKADVNNDGVINVSDVILIMKNVAGWEYTECPLYSELQNSRMDYLETYITSFGYRKFTDYSRNKYFDLFYNETPISEVEEYIRYKTVKYRDNDGGTADFNSVRGHFYNDTQATFVVYYLLYNGWTYKMVHNLIYDAYYETTVS